MRVIAKHLGTVEFGENTFVTDPGNLEHPEEILGKVEIPTTPGLYDVYIIYGIDGEYKQQPVSLIAVSIDCSFHYGEFPIVGWAPVDSGKIGFFDKEFRKDYPDFEKFFEGEVAKHSYNTFEFGAFCSFGDGYYPVTISREDEEVTAIQVDFAYWIDNDHHVHFHEYDIEDFLDNETDIWDIDLSDYDDDDYDPDEDDDLPEQY